MESDSPPLHVSRPRKRQKKLPCHPFNRDQAYPSPKELERLRTLDQDGEVWLRERLNRMGASSSSCIVGLGPSTPWDYWRLKTHRLERQDTEKGKQIMQRGHTLEPLAADAYEILMESGPLYQEGIVVHPNIAWIHCSPDRLIQNQATGMVEIKCPVHGLPTRIPDKYMCQVQQQMECTNKEWCDLFYYYYDDETNQMMGVKCWRIWRSKAYWTVMEAAMKVMADCFMQDREPTAADIPLRPQMPPVRVKLQLEWDFSNAS